ncbi:putative pentatricopeptide repeat-containing protein [Tanacetum coccineum]
MRDWRVQNEGGLSWIEVCGQVHVFLAGDRRHEDTEKIYTKLSELQEKILKLGYVQVYDQMMHELGGGEKMEALWYHNEKLALAFGLVVGAAPPGKALRIVKNLRICRDCHEAFKCISLVVDREIIVRDVNRYHRVFARLQTLGSPPSVKACVISTRSGMMIKFQQLLRSTPLGGQIWDFDTGV